MAQERTTVSLKDGECNRMNPILKPHVFPLAQYSHCNILITTLNEVLMLFSQLNYKNVQSKILRTKRLVGAFESLTFKKPTHYSTLL